jgi:predicted Zn finger-like uncharacterized protein
MKVQCGQCPAKYAVADDRIRDKKVRIRCRRCNAAIVVDGKVEPPLVTSTPARPSARPLSSMPPDSAPPSSPDSRSSAPRPVAHTIMGGLEAPVGRKLVQEHVAQTRAAPPSSKRTAAGSVLLTEPRAGRPASHRGFTDPPVGGEPDRWRVALTQQDLRWMTTDEILQAFRAGAVKSETFVYRAGMPTWVTLMEVGEIARALSDAGLAAPGSFATAGAPNDAPEERPSSPPPRPSSLPPPRKGTRNRGAPTAPHDALPDEGAEPDESLPFQLVSGRANGSKKTVESPAPAASDAARESSAASEDDAALATPLVPASAEAWASNDTSAPVNAGTDASADAGPAPVAAATPSLAVPPVTSAAPESGGALWIWVLLVVLLVLGAALFFGPRFGLRLP